MWVPVPLCHAKAFLPYHLLAIGYPLQAVYTAQVAVKRKLCEERLAICGRSVRHEPLPFFLGEGVLAKGLCLVVCVSVGCLLPRGTTLEACRDSSEPPFTSSLTHPDKLRLNTFAVTLASIFNHTVTNQCFSDPTREWLQRRFLPLQTSLSFKHVFRRSKHRLHLVARLRTNAACSLSVHHCVTHTPVEFSSSAAIARLILTLLPCTRASNVSEFCAHFV